MNIVKDKKGRTMSFLLTAFLAVLIAIADFVPVGASEIEANGIERNRSSSITMTVNTDEWYVDGATFRLYKVADLADDLTFSFVDAFKDCGVDVSLSPNSDYMQTAADLISYVQKNNIEEDASLQIHNRTVTFSNLSLGLYLVQGDTATEGNRTVTYQPVVICIPQRNSATESWKYDVTSQVKSAKADVTTETPSTEEPSTEKPSTETPAKPTNPSTPSNTSNKSKTTTTGKKVKTGDTSRTGFYLAVILVDAAAIGAIVLLKRRSDKKRGR